MHNKQHTPLVVIGIDTTKIQSIVDEAPEQLRPQIYQQLTGSTQSRDARREEFRKSYRRPHRRRRETLKEIRAWFRDYKSHLQCCKCPESDPACLVFHHKDPASKEVTIGALLQRATSKAEVLREISKCIVLCANCHAKLHRDLRQQTCNETTSPKIQYRGQCEL